MKAHERPEKCGGPGAKIIYLNREDALCALREYSKGKRANARQGKVYSCPWGDHWHYSSKKTGGKRR